ncbi:conserved hypothetical protein [uncultured Desulfobacterium sp.]|uniref:Radical SAM core domain-containing protein n=1 Tax=uncultured Desulfobacterium sp. TaxID=201089 RepID=A0A445N1E6_9BACT|nr:conserved hypothetical protein [uncultured Desulfobacterium sp.]
MSDRRPRPLIVPIFIPHLGCPHRCVFCEQKRITSQKDLPVSEEHIIGIIERAIHSAGFDPNRNPEIAFYGGTFTGLPFDQMLFLLETVFPYITKGLFRGIRVSTRPDAVNDERLKAIRHYNVSTVELGAQSMDDQVLTLSERGHSSDDTARAVRLLRQYGLSVGIQLMPGLPGDSADKFHSTVTKVIDLKPDMVRLYPALVIKGTGLARLYEKGIYHPLGLGQAVEICADNCLRLEDMGIQVIRIGLMSSPSLLEEGQIIAGPWHPAFGFLVRSAIYHKGIAPMLPGRGQSKSIRIMAYKLDIPLIRGYKNQGVKLIENRTGAKVVNIQAEDSITPGRIKVVNI